MALVPDQKFSTFDNGGDLEVDDIVVGLRGGINTRFNYTGELPPGVVVPIINGGTGATTAAQARVNLGLGTIAVQDADNVAITGGSAALDLGSVVAAPVAGIDIANKTYVDSQISGAVTSAQGTANQILINGLTTVQTGALVFTTPQDIATSSNVTFGSVKFSTNIGLLDQYGNVILGLAPGAVSTNNYFSISNNGSAVSPVLRATGTATDLNIEVACKGTGGFKIYSLGTYQIIVNPGNGSVNNNLAFPTIVGYNYTFPSASGTIALTSGLPTPSALTKTDDTNVTLTLGGTPATALLQATSLTLGWTGTLAPSRGGLGIADIPSNGFIPIGNGTNYVSAAITAGVGITVTNGSGTITLSSTGAGLTAISVAGTTQALTAGNAYIYNNAAATTGTLPTSGTSTVGDVIKVKGNSAAPFIIQANTGQTIKNGSVSSTVAGTATSAAGTDTIQLMYIAANTWSVDFTLSAAFVLA